jgi:hypothetical protein
MSSSSMRGLALCVCAFQSASYMAAAGGRMVSAAGLAAGPQLASSALWLAALGRG